MSKKILIIEDEEYLSELYKMRFEQSGYEVFAADDGLEGLMLAEKELPGLILLDIMLPGMNGYEVLEKLKKNAKTKDLKVFFLSNLVQNGEIKKGIEAGADDYLIKSNLTPTQLFEKVDAFFLGEKTEAVKTVSGTAAKAKGKPKTKSNGVKENGKHNILIVEDNDALIDMYMEAFAKAGLIVDIARNGAWGIKLALEKDFDLIVLDMVMPAMDGYGLIKKLKESEKTENMPIIVLSNSAQDGDIDKAKAAGVSSYLLKSKVTPSQLVKEIKKLLN